MLIVKQNELAKMSTWILFLIPSTFRRVFFFSFICDYVCIVYLPKAYVRIYMYLYKLIFMRLLTFFPETKL